MTQKLFAEAIHLEWCCCIEVVGVERIFLCKSSFMFVEIRKELDDVTLTDLVDCFLENLGVAGDIAAVAIVVSY